MSEPHRRTPAEQAARDLKAARLRSGRRANSPSRRPEHLDRNKPLAAKPYVCISPAPGFGSSSRHAIDRDLAENY